MNRTRLHPLSLALIAALSHTATAQTSEQTQTPPAVALAPIVVNVNPLFNNYTVADSSAATGLNLSPATKFHGSHHQSALFDFQGIRL